MTMDAQCVRVLPGMDVNGDIPGSNDGNTLCAWEYPGVTMMNMKTPDV